MTGVERFEAVMRGERPDRIPTMLHAFMPAAMEAGFTMADYRNSAENIAKTHLDFANKYDLDGMLMDIDTCMLANAIGVPTDFPINEPARATGACSKDLNYLIEKMDKNLLHNDDRIKISLDAINLMKARSEGKLVRGNCDQMAFSMAMLLYGMEDFMMGLLDEDEEDLILQLMDRTYDVHLEYHKMMHEAGADMTSFGDSSCGPDLISADLYRKYGKPFHKRLKEDLEKLNIKTVCHICGNLDRIVEDVADVEFPAVEIDYKTNIPNAKKAFEGKSTVFGVIDPSGMFYFAKPEEIYAETIKTLEVFEGKGYVPGAGCALPFKTPEANIRAFVKATRDFKF